MVALEGLTARMVRKGQLRRPVQLGRRVARQVGGLVALCGEAVGSDRGLVAEVVHKFVDALCVRGGDEGEEAMQVFAKDFASEVLRGEGVEGDMEVLCRGFVVGVKSGMEKVREEKWSPPGRRRSGSGSGR